MVISQFDYQMYMDEIAELREQMTQLLLSMELNRQAMSGEDFDRWWYGDGGARTGGDRHEGEDDRGGRGNDRSAGSMARYYSMKARMEQIENYLSRVQVEEQAHAKMRRGKNGGSVSRFL